MEINMNNLAEKIKDESFINEVSKNYFNHYDKNHNNSLEKSELLKIMKDISKTFFGCIPEKGAIESQFESLDKDKNNRIDFVEFKVFIKDYLKMIVEF